MCHRRYGKDFIALLTMVICATQYIGNYYIYAPFQKQAREIITDAKTYDGKPLLETLIPRELLLKAPQIGVVNKSDWSISLSNGSKIFIRGADNPNSSVGVGARGMIFTEAALMKPGFYQYMKPAIESVIDKTDFGFIMFISTPRGKHNWFTKLFTDYFTKLSKNPETQKKWYLDIQKASSSKAWNGAPVLSKKQLNDAKIEMSEDMFLQEYECDLNLAVLGSWYGPYIDTAFKERRIGRYGFYTNINDEFEETKYKGFFFPEQPVYISWDIGRRDHTVLWFFQINPHNNRIRFIHHYREKGAGGDHFIEYQKNWLEKYGLPPALNILPHDGNVTEWATETKRSDYLISKGLKVFVLDKGQLAENNQQSLMTQIETVRRTFKDVEIDSEECTVGIIKLQEYVKKFNKILGEYEDIPDHNKNDKASDDADSFRTAIIFYIIFIKPTLVKGYYENTTSYYSTAVGYNDEYSFI